MPAMAMAGGAGVSAFGGVVGGIFGSSAAKAQIKAMQAAIDYQKQKDAQTRADLSPYRDFGGNQLNVFRDWLTSPDKSSGLDPGYAFRLAQGNKGIEANAGTAGLLKSGDTLRGLTQYGQDAASQEYGNAFNRFMGESQLGANAAIAGGTLANNGAANVGNMTANTNWGGPQQVWGDVASGIGGGAGNALARRFPSGGGSTVPGGANVFGNAKPAYAAGATTPWYMMA